MVLFTYVVISIQFFTDAVQMPLSNRVIVADWLYTVMTLEGYRLKDLNVIFCADEELNTYNLVYLNHDNFTDIITFDYSEVACEISGELYISVERVLENSQQYNVSFHQELLRVLVHGVLHLMGYRDDTYNTRARMREKENNYLKKIKLCECSKS